MADIKLFRIDNGEATELDGKSVALERSLQLLIETNLQKIFGVRFVASEYATGKTHAGRIDTLGLDENGCPIIVEYKRAVNENVINQGLFYLDWLMDHKAEFKLLVMEKIGKVESDEIDWSGPRLLCIAADFTKYDEHAVQQINRNIELIRYRYFEDDLLLFELANVSAAENAPVSADDLKTGVTMPKTISQTLSSLDLGLRDLLESLKAFLLALGDDVQMKILKHYIAFRRFKNFACVEIHPAKGCITVFMKVDPGTILLQAGFTRDVRKIGHYGTGDLEVTLQSMEDLERAKELLTQSYAVS